MVYKDLNPIELQGKEVINLLETSGTYNVDRYPWAYEAWKKQQQIHWIGEEVPLGSDVQDWHGDSLTDNERNLLTQIFRLFTQSDIEVADNYFKRYIPIFQPLEIQMMMAAFTNMETVHIDAYALLLKTIGMPNTEFSAFKDYSQMRAKIDYMHTFGTNTCLNVSKTLAMFGAFTEGMSLFASFAMLMNFPRFNKMKGMGQIITWSIRDESLHCNSIIKLFHTWNQETGITNNDIKNDIYNICNEMVSLEDKFIELAFELGSIQGMSSYDIKQYIRYIADMRLIQLGLKSIYGFYDKDSHQIKEHPLPWLPALLNTVEHANFFEARATEYSKGATKGDWHSVNDTKGTWELFDNFIGKKNEPR